MKLVLILRKLLPSLNPGQLLRLRLYHICLLQFLIDSLTDSLRYRRIFIHLRRFRLPLERKRHGRRHVHTDFPYCNEPSPDIAQDLYYAVDIPLVLQAFPLRLPDQGMARFVNQGGEHLRALQPLHPERLTAIPLHSHHERAGRIIAKGHIEQRRQGKRRLQNTPGLSLLDLEQQPFRKNVIPIRIQKKAVLLIHAADINSA